MNINNLAEHIKQLEISLLSKEAGKNMSDPDKIISDDFLEIGKSGKIWTKQALITSYENKTEVNITITDFRLKPLSDSILLAIYTAHHTSETYHPVVKTIRSSVWRLSGTGWEIVFHQGTIVPE